MKCFDRLWCENMLNNEQKVIFYLIAEAVPCNDCQAVDGQRCVALLKDAQAIYFVIVALCFGMFKLILDHANRPTHSHLHAPVFFRLCGLAWLGVAGPKVLRR